MTHHFFDTSVIWDRSGMYVVVMVGGIGARLARAKKFLSRRRRLAAMEEIAGRERDGRSYRRVKRGRCRCMGKLDCTTDAAAFSALHVPRQMTIGALSVLHGWPVTEHGSVIIIVRVLVLPRIICARNWQL